MRPSSLLVLIPLALIAALAGCTRTHRAEWPNGQPKQVGQLVGGKQDGVWTYWHLNGTKQAEGAWAQDRQVGEWTWWHPGGVRVKQQGRYEDGLRTGTWTYWHPDGQVYCRGDYDRDHQVGPWSYHHPNGRLAAVGWFAYGTKALGWRWWREDGSPLEQGAFADGRRVGPWTAWTADGAATTTDQGCPPGGECFREPAEGGTPRRWLARWTVASPHALVAGAPAGEVRELALAFDDAGRLTAASARMGARDLASAFHRPDGGIVEHALGAGGDAVYRQRIDALHAQPSPAPVAAPEAKPDLTPVDPARPGLSPLTVLPAAYFTAREQANTAALIERFRSGAWRPDPAAAYELPAAGASSATQRPDLIARPLAVTRLLGADGEVIDLDDFKGRSHVVLVVLRGFAGQLCVYCATQTAALAKSADRFREAGARVILVYPGAPESVPVFLDAVASLGVDRPLAMALDVELQLVGSLMISHQLAKPTSLIIDKEGLVRYAYVGVDRADRPSADELLRQVKRLAR